MKLSENVYMLEVKGKQTCYPVLIHDENKLVLIDTSFPMEYEPLCRAIKSNGFEVDDISDIIITHQDIDHIGCIKEILAVKPEVEIMASAIETPYIDGQLTPVKLAKMDTSNPFYEQFKAGFDNRRISISKELSDKDILPFCGGIEVVHTPGHTPGHICLYIKRDKIMICGDALNITEGNLVGSNPIHTDNMEDAERSKQKILSFDIDTFVTYHGGMLVGSKEGVGKAF